MNGGSRKSEWVFIAVLAILAGCATEPYYEAAPITPVNVSPGEDVNIGVNAQMTFVWQSTENTQFYEFHIYNQNSKDTTQYRHDNLREDSVCQEGVCRLTLNVDLPTSKGHAWRVRAGNNAGLSEWNRTRFNMIEASADSKKSTTLNAGVESSVSAETVTSAETSVGAKPTTSVETSVNTKANVSTEISASTGETINAEVTAGEQTRNSVAAGTTSSETIPSVELIASVEESTEPDTKAQTDNDVEAEASAVSNSSMEQNGPDLLQPVEDAKVATGSLIDFKWRSLPDATSYDFYIYDSEGEKMVESLTEISASTLCRGESVCVLTRVVSMPEASHSWKVRANFRNDQSPFTISRFAVMH